MKYSAYARKAALLASLLMLSVCVIPVYAQQKVAAASNAQPQQAMLPPTSTSSVDINTCDMDFIGGKSRPGSGGPGDPDAGGGSGGGGDPGSNYPPSPGEGYQPMTQHGEFVGWYSPAEVAMSANGDFPGALRSILRSDRYYGGIMGAASILYELGDISSPFATDEAQAWLNGG